MEFSGCQSVWDFRFRFLLLMYHLNWLVFRHLRCLRFEGGMQICIAVFLLMHFFGFSSYGGGVNALTSRPWHLSSMLGKHFLPSLLCS